MAKKKYSKTLEGFIAQQNGRGIGVTTELMEHLEDVKYRELPWWKRMFTESPDDVRRFNMQFCRSIGEYIREQSKL